jgi:hypothetical protein
MEMASPTLIMEEILKIVKETPNDMELGRLIRKMVNTSNTNSLDITNSKVDDWYKRNGKSSSDK